MKKTKVCLCALTAVASVGVISAVALNNANVSPSKANDDPYTLTLNKANQLTAAEQTAGSFKRDTSLGNTIDFTHSGAQYYESTGFFQTRANGAYIANSTPINGLSSIKILGNDDPGNNRTYRILFGNTFGEYLYSTDNTVSTKNTVQEFTVPQYETPFSFFKVEVTQGNWTHFISVEIIYSCSDKHAARGQEYTPTSGSQYDFKNPVPVAEGSVINVDVKRTDLGSQNGQISMCLFQDWDTSFGYKTLNMDTKTGDVPGLTVTPLSDGYIRYSWTLTDMTGGTLTSVAFVHIDKRDGWTTSSGYFDVDSTAPVVEYKGKRFTAAAGLDVTLETPVPVDTGKIQFDFYYTTIGKVSFAICDSGNNYYGYFDMKQVGNNSSVWGLQVVSESNGFVRFTFEASKISGKKVGTPANINYISIHKGDGSGGWTTADGYIDIKVLS